MEHIAAKARARDIVKFLCHQLFLRCCSMSRGVQQLAFSADVHCVESPEITQLPRSASAARNKFAAFPNVFFFQLKRPPASPCVAGKRRQAVFFSHSTSPRLATLFRSFVQAIAYYEKSLSSGQQGSKLRLELAEFLLRLKQYPRAMRVLQKVRSAVCPASVLPKTPF